MSVSPCQNKLLCTLSLASVENINDRLFDEWISLKIDTGGLIANLVKTKECATIVDGWL